MNLLRQDALTQVAHNLLSAHAREREHTGGRVERGEGEERERQGGRNREKREMLTVMTCATLCMSMCSVDSMCDTVTQH